MSVTQNNWQRQLESLGLAIPRIIMPAPRIDLHRWAIVACDQHTDNPHYWQKVKHIVGSSPSTLHLMVPEIYLDDPNLSQRLRNIAHELRRYLQQGILQERGSMVLLIRRTFSDGRIQQGLLMAVDLERFSYKPSNSATILSSEEIIHSRIAPRCRLRHMLPMEFPHVLLLYEDPRLQLMRWLLSAVQDSNSLYHTILMLQGGEVTAWPLQHTSHFEHLSANLEALLQPSSSKRKLLIVGDGNHSLAAAKQHWELLKNEGAPANHPARYALAELVNIYDPGLKIAPIHRLLCTDSEQELRQLFRALQHQLQLVPAASPGTQSAGKLLVQWKHRYWLASPPATEFPIVYLERQLDILLPQFPSVRRIYVHGYQELARLTQQQGGIALLVPAVERSQLIHYVSHQGMLPSKSFSLGEATDKRYYIEGRAISSFEEEAGRSRKNPTT